VNIEMQRMWEEAKNSVVFVELDNMTNDCGLLVKILSGYECLDHVVVGQQLHIDYKPEETAVEKAMFAESGYSIGTEEL